MKTKTTLIFLVSVLCLSCRSQNDKPIVNNYSKIIHPTNSNIPSETIKLDVVEGVNSEPFLFLSNLILEIGKEGALNTDSEDLLGEVTAAEIYQNNLIILDSKLLQLRIYNLRGDLISKYEIGGRGPGESLLPITFEINKNRLFLLDGYNKIDVFNLSESEIEYVESIDFKITPEDMCIMNEQILVRGVGIDSDSSDNLSSNIIHSFSAVDYTFIRSFGDGYKSNNWLTVNQMSDGPLACSDSKDQIYFSYEYMPYVYTLELDSKLSSIYEFEDEFESGQITENYEDGVPTISFSPNSETKRFEQIKLLTVDESTNILYVQSTLVERKNNEIVRKNITNAISLDHNIKYVGGESMPIILSVNSEYIVASQTDPFPQIKIYKRQKND